MDNLESIKTDLQKDPNGKVAKRSLQLLTIPQFQVSTHTTLIIWDFGDPDHKTPLILISSIQVIIMEPLERDRMPSISQVVCTQMTALMQEKSWDLSSSTSSAQPPSMISLEDTSWSITIDLPSSLTLTRFSWMILIQQSLPLSCWEFLSMKRCSLSRRHGTSFITLSHTLTIPFCQRLSRSGPLSWWEDFCQDTWNWSTWSTIFTWPNWSKSTQETMRKFKEWVSLRKDGQRRLEWHISPLYALIQ